jgi:predicted lipid-binding transport protein (Tim44 family)
VRGDGRGAARPRLRRPFAPLAGALLLLPSAVLARGGGGSHGGGGHSSGGHGGGHSGGFHGSFGHSGSFGHAVGGAAFGAGSGLAAVLVTLVIMLVIFAIVIYIAYRVIRVQRGFATAALGGAAQPMQVLAQGRPTVFMRPAVTTDQTAAAGAALSAMRASDPAFEPETFLQRSEMTFFLVKRAYQQRDSAAAQPYLVPALFATWSAAVQTLIAEHRRPLLESLNVRGLHVADAKADPATGDEIVVHFDFVFRGKTFDDRDGRLLADTGDDERYGERWTFVRGAGVKSVESGGVVAQKCPSCGAPLELSTDAVCKHCGAEATTGAFDWSVSAIAPAPFSGIALDPLLDQVQLPPDEGLAEIRGSDPSFDPGAFIARVKQAFATLQDAWQARDVDTGRGFMSPGLYFSWSAQVEQMRDEHRRNVLEGMRIDRVIPVRVLHGHVFDDVTVRIDATCADYEIDETSGRIVFGDKTPRPFTEYWTFQRAIGTKTGERSLLDKVCPNCGAPLDVTQLGECRYCKAAVTSGRFDWVLSRIEQQEEYSAGSVGN